jgi:hypothetical protein
MSTMAPSRSSSDRGAARVRGVARDVSLERPDICQTARLINWQRSI